MTGFGRLFYRLGVVAFVVVGVGQLIWCVRESAEAITATRWPTVAGTVERAEVLEVKTGRRTGYVPHVTYVYEVDRVRYEGNRIHISDVSEFHDQAYHTITPFSANGPVRVYFDRRDPSRSLLKPGLYWYSAAWFALAVMAIVVGIAAFHFSKRKRAE